MNTYVWVVGAIVNVIGRTHMIIDKKKDSHFDNE